MTGNRKGKTRLRLLLIEDDDNDIFFILRVLQKAGIQPIYRRVETFPELKRMVENESWDLILCDYSFPGFNALDVLQFLKEQRLDVPFIVVSGVIGDEAVVKIIKAGAQDFIPKDRLNRLIPVMERELQEAEHRRKQKEAESELQISEELHRLILQNISDVIFITDDAGHFIFICPNVHAIFGYSMDEVSKMGDIHQLFGCNLFQVEDLRKKGEIPNVELRILDKYQKKHVLLVSIKHISFGKGTILYSCRDITHRTKHAEKLRKSQYRLAEAQRIAQMGSWDWQLKDDVLYWSDEAYCILGIDPLHFGFDLKSFLDCIHPEDREFVRTAIQEVLQKKKRLDIDYRIIHENQEERFVNTQAAVVLDSNENPIRLVGTIQDITERKRLELERIMLEEELRNTVSDGVITVATDGTISNLNKSALRLFQVNRDEAVGHSLETVLSAQYFSFLDIVRQSLNTQRYIRYFQIQGVKKGQQWTYLINVTPLKGIKGGGAVIVIRDISRLRALEFEMAERYAFHNMIGKSAAITKVFETIRQLADIDATVLIQGASGTGKELVANALHCFGNRKNSPLVKVNCSALSETLSESELFGHVRGAFTGAFRDKTGRFEHANGGTIFLDEIGDISIHLQKRLLRVLQEREIERVGSTKTIKINVRIIAATNKDLWQMVQQGEFREDLYYRLNVVKIKVPCLRERRDDIPLLVQHFLQKYQDLFNRNIEGIEPDVMNVFLQYDWPGNVRELENTVERAVALTPDGYFHLDQLPSEIYDRLKKEKKTETAYHSSLGIKKKMDFNTITRETLVELLNSVGWNRKEAAKRLGIHRTTLWRIMKKMELG